MVHKIQLGEDDLHQDIAFSAKPTLMIRSSVKFLSIPRITKLSNAIRTMHVICASRPVSIKPAHVPRQ